MNQSDPNQNNALAPSDGSKLSLDLADKENSPAPGAFNPNLLASEPAGEQGDASPQLFSKKSSPYKGQTMFIAVVLVLGAGAIFGMRQLAVSAAKAGELFKLDFKPEAADTESEIKFHRVMAELERSGRPVQVPIEQLGGSPFLFSFDSDEQVAEPIPGEDPSIAAQREARLRAQREAERLAAEAAARENALQSALKDIRIEALIGGDTPLARINGENIRVGDAIGELFTAVRIEGRGILVRSGDRYFVLQMNRDPREVTPE